MASTVVEHQVTVSDVRSSNDDEHDTANTLWHQLDWERLLISGPSSIALLGKLINVGLVNHITFEQGSKPNEPLNNLDFRAGIVKLRNELIGAFSASHIIMDKLSKKCQTLLRTTHDTIKLLSEHEMENMSLKEHSFRITELLPNFLDEMAESVKECDKYVTECIAGFTIPVNTIVNLKVLEKAENGVDRTLDAIPQGPALSAEDPINSSDPTFSKELNKPDVDPAGIDPQNFQWEEFRKVLGQAIKQLVRLSEFFAYIQATVTELLKPTIDGLTKRAGTQLEHVKQVPFDLYAKKTFAKDCTHISRIAVVLCQIGTTYRALYNSQIVKGMNLLSNLPILSGGDQVAATNSSGKALEQWSLEAQDEMRTVLAKSSQDFKTKLGAWEERLKTLKIISSPLPTDMTEVVAEVPQRQKRQLPRLAD
ncbi:hypothetical protein CPB83DRAFT_864332 [Crepidotus variabilis]|uniref:Uncharacterized protein n=1 Tax=Crepidotus variabilis TaxID=179855 RepID=A0A9P6E502_9AGAR|nr:hypothetical protein CPB83DRAFT_864332 [Crepidotus variabilis]